MTKNLTVVGTRPELIRLSRIIPKLDQVCQHILIHTGQNHNPLLKDIFFEELNIRQPNYYLNIDNQLPLWLRIGEMLNQVEKILIQEKPDKVLILGDTYSGLSAIVSERLQIPVYHCEAGNRSYSKEVPEEINRQIIDHISSYNLPYTQRSKQNLLLEGLPLRKIYVTGNPIKEVLDYYNEEIEQSNILEKLNLTPKKYFLSTFHRFENVDNPERLNEIIEGLNKITSYYHHPIIISTHPHTRNKLKDSFSNDYLKFLDPMGFFDFVKLEKNALCVLSDSGTVPEETTILRIPSIILRNETERPEILDVGSSILSGINRDKIFSCTEQVINSPTNWELPENYDKDNVSQTVINILMSKI